MTGEAALGEARALLAKRHWAQAGECAQRAFALEGLAAADRAALHFVAGVAALEQRQIAPAIVLLQRAAGLRGDDAATWVQLARAFSQAQRGPDALAAAARAAWFEPQDASSLDTLGVVFSRAEQHEDAVRWFERAVRERPGNAAFQFNLASSLKFLGRFDEAQTAYEACVACDETFWKAYSALAQLRRQTTEAPLAARLRELLARPSLPVEGQLHLNLALAKSLEDLGQPQAAFVHTARGKSAMRGSLRYDSADDARLFDALHAAFAEPREAPPPPTDPSRAPIFVVGMPRTGTTLVERILGCHPQVVAVGESQNLPRVIKRAAGTRSAEVLDVETIRNAASIDLSDAGERYLAQTRPAGAPRFVDKMPMNFFYAGFIRRALPQARIVCLRRHPLDACLSNFRQLFALNFPYYRYAYDLLDTGRYYVQFDRLVAHWRRVLPGALIEVDYESLVASPEAEIRRMLAFVGLEWDAACLRSEHNPAPVSTASAVQVRAPIHRAAVGRWQALETELSGLRALLERAGIAVPAAA